MKYLHQNSYMQLSREIYINKVYANINIKSQIVTGKFLFYSADPSFF